MHTEIISELLKVGTMQRYGCGAFIYIFSEAENKNR